MYEDARDEVDGRKDATDELRAAVAEATTTIITVLAQSEVRAGEVKLGEVRFKLAVRVGRGSGRR